ncbi:ATP-binding protein [Streptomyces sp. A73]|uniref:ATP-binding protein n=1 Tax=Streptomyces smyrnaeus TaxID=1387713 RepID=UPI001B4697BE|nr:ATP-binding protein [Streptomyces sp. A73]
MTNEETHTGYWDKPATTHRLPAEPWPFTPRTDEAELALDSFKTEWDALVAQGQARRDARMQLNSTLAATSAAISPGGADRLAAVLAELRLLSPDEAATAPKTEPGRPPVTMPEDNSGRPPTRGGVRLFVPGARLVPTNAVTAAAEAVEHTAAARGIACISGERGVGKTVAIHQALQLLPTRSPVWQAVIGVKPSLPQLRACLLEALGLPAATLTRRPRAADHALKQVLRQPGVLFLDDAQRLPPPLLDYLRLLWDEPGTAAALVLCGAGAERGITRVPALRARVLTWHKVARVEPDHLTETLATFHDVWEGASPADVKRADAAVARGNFRTWAKITSHLYALAKRSRHTRADSSLIKQACARLAPTP